MNSSTDCSYSKKAFNVRQMGASMMILISDDKNLEKEYGSDSDFGSIADIPTLFIDNKVGQILKNEMKDVLEPRIIINVQFNSVKNNDNLVLELFFRSDDVKALGFFKEFNSYREKLLDKLTFVPVYKYHRYDSGETPDDSLLSNGQNPCVKGYCTGRNRELRIKNARIVLLENIRQSCMFTLSQEAYWNYMVTFFETCANLYLPLFNEECSNNVLQRIGYTEYTPQLTKCMNDLIHEEGKIEQDYKRYEEKKVYKVPELLINGMRYRGNWYGRWIFNSICNGFIDDEKICKVITIEEKKSSGIGNSVKIFFTVIIILVITMVILLICYRRIVDKTINQSYIKIIQDQTVTSLELNQKKLSQATSESA